MPAAQPSPSDILRDRKIRPTRQRMRVFHVFQDAQRRHLNADDVYRALLAEGTPASHKTIYRILLQFEETGVLRRCRFLHPIAVYELSDSPPHDHCVCLQCGRVEEFSDPDLEALKHKVALSRGFSLKSTALTLTGICANCRKDSTPPYSAGIEHSAPPLFD